MKSFNIFFFLFPLYVYSQSSQSLSKSLEKSVDSIMMQNFKKDAPGAVLLIAKDHDILYHKAFGKADLELDVPMRTDMVFEIGSITKQFTAIAVLKLMEQGKLSLQDDIKKFIPDYPTYGHSITIHHLLNQTSGIKELLSIKDKNNLASISYKPLELISIFKDQPLDFIPGTKWSYSNSNYSILGYIIEKASGLPYAKFMEQNIFKPAGMLHSMDGSSEKIIKNRVPGYYRGRTGTFYNSNFLHLSYPYASGSILSTAVDMYKWQQALNKNFLVKEITKAKAFHNYNIAGKETDYGYGWSLNEIGGSLTFEHSGGTAGFASNGIYIPDQQVYVILLSNCVSYRPEAISTVIASFIIEKPRKYPAVINLSADKLKKFEGKYLLEDGREILITYTDNGLIEGRYSPKQIFPYKDKSFFVEGSFEEFEFKSNELNEVTEVVFRNRKEHYIGKKEKE